MLPTAQPGIDREKEDSCSMQQFRGRQKNDLKLHILLAIITSLDISVFYSSGVSSLILIATV